MNLLEDFSNLSNKEKQQVLLYTLIHKQGGLVVLHEEDFREVPDCEGLLIAVGPTIVARLVTTADFTKKEEVAS